MYNNADIHHVLLIYISQIITQRLMLLFSNTVIFSLKPAILTDTRHIIYNRWNIKYAEDEYYSNIKIIDKWNNYRKYYHSRRKFIHFYIHKYNITIMYFPKYKIIDVSINYNNLLKLPWRNNISNCEYKLRMIYHYGLYYNKKNNGTIIYNNHDFDLSLDKRGLMRIYYKNNLELVVYRGKLRSIHVANYSIIRITATNPGRVVYHDIPHK